MAKNEPLAFREHVIKPLFRQSLRRAAKLLLWYWGAAVALFGITAIISSVFTDPRSGWVGVGAVVVVSGLFLALGGYLTLGTFLIFTGEHFASWNHIVSLASDSDSYEMFEEKLGAATKKSSWTGLVVTVVMTLLPFGLMALADKYNW